MFRWAALILVSLVAVIGCSSVEPSIPPPLGPLGSDVGRVHHAPAPTAIRIPSIKAASSDVIPLGLQADGAMQVPPLEKVQQAGWYCPTGPSACGAPKPGQTGPAVIAAHVDGFGKPGLFHQLHRVKVGALVEVDRDDGTTATFRVTEVWKGPKTEFPSLRVYGDTAGPALRLVTCGGTYDPKNRRYLDNIVAFADLVP